MVRTCSHICIHSGAAGVPLFLIIIRIHWMEISAHWYEAFWIIFWRISSSKNLRNLLLNWLSVTVSSPNRTENVLSSELVLHGQGHFWHNLNPLFTTLRKKQNCAVLNSSLGHGCPLILSHIYRFKILYYTTTFGYLVFCHTLGSRHWHLIMSTGFFAD